MHSYYSAHRKHTTEMSLLLLLFNLKANFEPKLKNKSLLIFMISLKKLQSNFFFITNSQIVLFLNEKKNEKGLFYILPISTKINSLVQVFKLLWPENTSFFVNVLCFSLND